MPPIPRSTLLAVLTEAAVGLDAKEAIEQSASYIFTGPDLITFNDAIMVRAKNPIGLDAVVCAQDLLQMLRKLPDDDVEITVTDTKLRVTGQNRNTWIARSVGVNSPITAVPAPTAWNKLGEETAQQLIQAARTCGTDESQHLSTCVHVTPKRVEGCDNYRLLRFNSETGFTRNVLIPAKSLLALRDIEMVKVSQEHDGWVHFRTSNKTQVSVRCSHDEYHSGIDSLLVMSDPKSVTLPSNLKDMLDRAQVMNTAEVGAKVTIRIADGNFVISSRKEGGGFRETRSTKYTGKPLDFDVNPDILGDVLARTRNILVDDRRIKAEVDNYEFVATLNIRAADAAEGE